MDSLMTLLPAGASGVAFVAIIGYLLKSNATDRRDYQEAVDRAEARADMQAQRAAAAEVALDLERSSRRRIEDAADVISRQLAALRVMSAHQTEVITSIQEHNR